MALAVVKYEVSSVSEVNTKFAFSRPEGAFVAHKMDGGGKRFPVKNSFG
jgi:hypothetical protein